MQVLAGIVVGEAGIAISRREAGACRQAPVFGSATADARLACPLRLLADCQAGRKVTKCLSAGHPGHPYIEARVINMQASLRLHIGSGRTRIAGFVNIDQIPGCDLQLDLNKDRLPFEDNSVDCVFSYHALEHFENYLFVLGEIWRVLQHGGRLLIEAPYVTLSEYNLVNPYHKQHFNEHSFAFFEIGRLKASANENNPILFTKGWHRYHYLPEFEHMPEPRRTYARRHMFNVVRAIDFGLYAVKPPATRIDLDADASEMLRSEFDRYFAARALII